MFNFPHELDESWHFPTSNGQIPSSQNVPGSALPPGSSDNQPPDNPIDLSQPQSPPFLADSHDGVPPVDTSDEAIAAFVASYDQLIEPTANQSHTQSWTSSEGPHDHVLSVDTSPGITAASGPSNGKLPEYSLNHSQPPVRPFLIVPQDQDLVPSTHSFSEATATSRALDNHVPRSTMYQPQPLRVPRIRVEEAESSSSDPCTSPDFIPHPLVFNETVEQPIPAPQSNSNANLQPTLPSTPYHRFVFIYHNTYNNLTRPHIRRSVEQMLSLTDGTSLTVHQCHVIYVLRFRFVDEQGQNLSDSSISAVLSFMRGNLYTGVEGENFIEKFGSSPSIQKIMNASVDGDLEWWLTCAKIEYYGYLVEMGMVVKKQVFSTSIFGP